MHAGPVTSRFVNASTAPVAIATCANAAAIAACTNFAGVEKDDLRVIEALRARGIEAVHAVWDDPAVDWQSFALVVIRSTWDYIDRRDEFLAWADRWFLLGRANLLFFNGTLFMDAVGGLSDPSGVVVSPGVTMGRNCKIQNNVSLYTGVILEDDVFCGPSMVFTNVVNPRSAVVRRDEYKQTLVKKGASIGANATIVCGHTIGAHAFIGAGAVVTKDVPDYALMVGNPARRTGWMCRCGIKLQAEGEEFTCSACHAHYKLDCGRLSPAS